MDPARELDVKIPSPIDAMRARSSCRTYDGRPLADEETGRLRAFLGANTSGPFGNPVRFELIDLGEEERGELRRLGTYGVIRRAGLFIAGAVTRGPRAQEDYGYAMERNILFATALGLGTCWLGGTLNRAGFARRLGVGPRELVPAISPVGRSAERRSLTDRVFRFAAKSDHRKPWSELFFDGAPGVPLTPGGDSAIGRALECVRLAPSASNRQPWRVVRDRAALHFFLERTPGYDKLTREVKLQEVDMGIALCHFELAAAELGLAGALRDATPPFDPGPWEYVTSWIG